jgi:hypothetical protein
MVGSQTVLSMTPLRNWRLDRSPVHQMRTFGIRAAGLGTRGKRMRSAGLLGAKILAKK